MSKYLNQGFYHQQRLAFALWSQTLLDNAVQTFNHSYGTLLTTMHKLCLDSLWMKISPQSSATQHLVSKHCKAANYRKLWSQKYNENHQRILTCIFEGMISNGQSSFNTTCLPLLWIWILLLEHQNRYAPRTSQPFQFSNSMPSPTTHATPIQFSQLEQPSCSSNPSKLGEYNLPGPSLHLDTVLTPFSHLLKGSH